LSFRTAAYVLGNVADALAELDSALAVQMNHSDDNPAAVAGPWRPSEADSGQVDRYRVDGAGEGALYPTANFEMLPVAVRLEHLTAALAQLSQSIAMQTIRFENPELTKLPRFLAAPTNEGHAFGALQKPLVALHVENRQLATPVSLDTLPIAGTVEDTASNAPLAAANLGRVLDNMYQLSSIQLLHAAQAVDLRRRNALGRSTQALLAAYRTRVPFVSEDRVHTGDFAAGVEVLHGFDGPVP
jgi:histidine ammonia-lyase